MVTVISAANAQSSSAQMGLADSLILLAIVIAALLCLQWLSHKD